jgi:hypothetical protein
MDIGNGMFTRFRPFSEHHTDPNLRQTAINALTGKPLSQNKLVEALRVAGHALRNEDLRDAVKLMALDPESGVIKRPDGTYALAS